MARKGKKKGKQHARHKIDKEAKLNSPGVTGYINRGSAIRKLQLDINQFRQMTIYKGVHPIEPSLQRLRKLKSRTWYSLQDINFMNRDEIVQYFRNSAIYKKKKTHLRGVNKPVELAALKTRKPRLNMDHYVLERYPSLTAAINDLDDALSILHLFAELETHSKIMKIMSKKDMKEILRLKAEWQRYIVEARALRKVFVSIKGVYYQAEVAGNTVTWLTPHPQQKLGIPKGVEIHTLAFFAQFYIAMLGFVFYRLYTELGYHYPPKIDISIMEMDEAIRAVQPVRKEKENKKVINVPKPQKMETLTTAEKERIAIVKQRLDFIISADSKSDKEEAELVEVKKEKDEADEAVPEEFLKKEGEKTEENEESNVEYMHDTSVLFKGLVFFVNREIPKGDLQFMIRACGGEDFNEYTKKESDHGITHQIVDRQWDRTTMKVNREYIQPQWVFDSINAGILLPYHEYAPDAVLPPHLSPFVDDKAEGYVPKQREHLDDLIKQKKGGEEGDEKKGKVKAMREVKEEEDKTDEGGKVIDRGEEEDEETSKLTEWETQYVKELAAEQEGRSYAGYVQDELGLTEMLESDEEEDEEHKKKEKERKDKEKKKNAEAEQLERMSLDLLSSRQRRAVIAKKKAAETIATKNRKLAKRALSIEKGKRMEREKAHKALPAPTPELVQKDAKGQVKRKAGEQGGKGKKAKH